MRAMTIATCVDPHLRSRLDAAGLGCFDAFHAQSVGETVKCIRERPVQMVLVSPSAIARSASSLTPLIQKFPAIPTVALVDRHDGTASRALLKLGAEGVTEMIDLTDRNGWRSVREAVLTRSSTRDRRILEVLVPGMSGCSPAFQRFMRYVVESAPRVTTVRRLCADLNICSSTFVSRFFRARLPSPKKYLSRVRLLHAIGMLQERGFTVTDVAYRLEYSSPQSFGRHVRALLGVTASELRRDCDVYKATEEFVGDFITPFEETLRDFHPTTNG